MEGNRITGLIMFSLRHPVQGIVKAFKMGGKVLRLCRRPRMLLNAVRARLSRNSEIITSSPYHIVLFTTDQCNLKCQWCLMNAEESKDLQHEKDEDMDCDAFSRILEKFPALEAISFTGQGEPLMNRDLFTMAAMARMKGLEVYLTTNGILLDEQNAEEIIRLGVYRINISLKGKDAQEYGKVTGSGEDAFHRVMGNIRRCVELKRIRRSDLLIRISYVVDALHPAGMEEVLALAEEAGVDCLLFDNLVPFHDFDTGNGCLFEDDSEVQAVLKRLQGRPSPVQVEWPVLLRRDRFTYHCRGYYEFLNIDAKGNVSGCMRVLAPQESYGNLFRDKSVMNTPHFRETRLMFMNGELPARCRFCIEMSR